VLAAWLALFIALGAGLVLAGSAFGDNTKLPSSDSATAYELLGRAGSAAASGIPGTIVWRVASGSAVSGAVRGQLEPALDAIAAVDGVVAVASPFTPAGAGQVSGDGRTAYATVLFASTARTGAVKQLAHAAAGAGVTVRTGGAAFTNQIPSEIGEIIGVLAALAILALVFRSAWAAALPIITGVAGVGLSALTVMLLSHLIAMSSIVVSMSALIGLGVGIDYALFIVNRQRKALRAGADVPTATATAMSTSGRAVLFAGTTVIIALAGMLILGVGFLTGIALAAVVTVALTVVAATTLLPALLAKAGPRVLRRRDRRALAAGAPILADPAGASEPGGFWAGWSRAVQRRPGWTAVGALLVLAALAAPAMSVRLGSADASSDPAGTATRDYYNTMSSAFGAGFDSQLLLVAQTPSDAARSDWDRFVAGLPGVPGVAAVSPSMTVGGPALSMVTVTPTTTSQAKATADLVSRLRADAAEVAAGSQLRIHVGGTTATTIDFASALMAKLPMFLAIVAVLGFLLLMIAFRSLAVPAIGAVGNLLTMAVALGVTVALFQWGWGPSMFGVGGGAPLEYVVAILIVGVVFGLSMDYHVFLVSRMHEHWVASADHHRAVRAGVADTGSVIATAAAIMACVFASFGFAGLRTAAEFGVGLAVAVLADAFLLRMTIVPALMHVLGPVCWALPASVARVLPRLSVEGGDPARSPQLDPQPKTRPQSQPQVQAGAGRPELVGARL